MWVEVGVLVSLYPPICPSVRPSIHLSVCRPNSVCSVSSIILAGSISYLHILLTNPTWCVRESFLNKSNLVWSMPPLDLRPYLSNKLSGPIKIGKMDMGYTMWDPVHDLDPWPHPWPLTWIVKVKNWNSCVSRMDMFESFEFMNIKTVNSGME